MFSLDDCNIHDAGALEICRVLQSNETLVFLKYQLLVVLPVLGCLLVPYSAYGNHFTRTGLTAFEDALKKNLTLVKLK